MTSAVASAPRYHSLDALRAVMMLLGLVLHAAISYGAFPYLDAWPFKDRSTLPFFDILVFTIHIFRMPVFYVMAGFFAAMLYVRRGPWGLARNRATRILVPFVVGWVVLYPLTVGGFLFAIAAQAGSFADGIAAVRAGASAGSLFFGDATLHLWFLYYLVFFYAAALALVPGLCRLPERWRAAGRRAFERLLESGWRAVVLAVPTAAALSFMRLGALETSTSFVPAPRVLLAYSLFFAFGWMLYGSREHLPSFRRRAWLQVLLGTVLVPVNMAAVGRVSESLRTDPVALWLSAASGALMVWWFVFGITGLFLRYLDQPSRRVRYIVDASYWLYLIHLPFTIWIPGLLSHRDLPAAVKFLLVLGISSPLWLASYDLLVRNTAIGRVLNGRRYPRGLPALEAVAGEAGPGPARSA